MATTYKTPGVYIEEIPKLPPSVAQVETAIPAFIGYTDKAKNITDDDLRLVPWRITSLLEFETFFGSAEKETNLEIDLLDDVDGDGNIISVTASAAFSSSGQSRHNMYYALQLYFGNGGGPCYIVSVGDYTDTTFGQTYNATALGEGLTALETVDEPTLIVFPEGQHIDSAANYYTLQNNALAQCAKLKDRFAVIDVYDNASATTTVNIDNFRGTATVTGIGANNLKYGAAYYPNLITTLGYAYDDEDVVVNHTRTTNGSGAAAGPFDGMNLDDAAFAGTLHYAKSKEAIGKIKLVMPPGAAVVGVYAAVDSSRGVWKAPANVSLNFVQDLADLITNDENAYMNVDATGGKSVNAIRAFTGKGILVWGARTLDGNSNEWRYVNVRRFFNMVEESSKKATEPFVFEPNDANTWVKVQSMLENFLTVLWRQGALQGAKPEHAFYVAVGLGKTMTALDILEGRMIVEIGLAVVRPAEFIILRFSHKMAES